MTYLLDANVWIALLRGKSPPAASRFRAVPSADLRVCSVVVAELRYGCARSAKPATNRAAVDALLAPYPSLPFDDAATDAFVSIRRHLESLGTPIGPYDLQIAAIALTAGCTLVTHNISEFTRVPALLVEDWEAP
ncbi:MAG: type II toxin-antitoxin system VapC family toxin [Gemmataceae bacterium]|nr:type II toxin-antitoxin system VapC family toxin [Gemmataceae bacterium]